MLPGWHFERCSSNRIFFINERKRNGNGMVFLLVFVGDEAQQVDLRLSTWWAVVFRFGLGKSCKNYMETKGWRYDTFRSCLVLVHYKMAHVQETQLQFWVANLVVTYDVVMLCARQSMHSMPTSLTRQGPPHSVRTSLWANYAVSRIGWNSDQIW